MTARSLRPEAEPIFALLVTDPKFSQTANEYLQPQSYGDRHYVGRLSALHSPEECHGCAPHRLVFLAEEAQPEPSVATVTAITPAKREVARSHGPKPKRRTS